MKTIKILATITIVAIFAAILLSNTLPSDWIEKRKAWLQGSNFYTDVSSPMNARVVKGKGRQVYSFSYRTEEGQVISYQRITPKTKEIAKAKRVYKTVTPSNQIMYCTKEPTQYCF